MPITPRDFLIRGLLAGLLAGLFAFGVAYVVGEPSLTAAIGYEESAGTVESQPADGTAHEHADGTAHDHGAEAEVPRSLQSTLGLLTATVVAGLALGGIAGVLSAIALGRVGLGARATAMTIAGIGFVAVYLMPSIGYPPNPPAANEADSIGYRTELYFVLLAISVIAATVATLTAVRLRPRLGGWYATLAAIAGYLVVMTVAIGLLPNYDETPAGFPADVLADFRSASLIIQFSLWAVLGVALAELVHRRLTRTTAGSAVRPTSAAVPPDARPTARSTPPATPRSNTP